MKYLPLSISIIIAVVVIFLPLSTSSRIVSPRDFAYIDWNNPISGDLEGMTVPLYELSSMYPMTEEIPWNKKFKPSADNCQELVIHGEPDDKLDIIFIATHLYSETGPGTKFAQDVEMLKQEFYNFPQYADNIDKINFYRVDSTYQNDECNEVSQNPICLNKNILIDIASQCAGYNPDHNDQVVVLFNGDVAPFNSAIAEAGFVYMPSNKGPLMMHEFGHSFAGLSDEYDKGVPPSPNEPQYPNCAGLADGNTCTDKWGNLMGQEGVNCFSTCGHPNWYRPTFNGSVMRDHELDNFCPVSEAHVNDLLSLYEQDNDNNRQPRSRLDFTTL